MLLSCFDGVPTFVRENWRNTITQSATKNGGPLFIAIAGRNVERTKAFNFAAQEDDCVVEQFPEIEST